MIRGKVFRSRKCEFRILRIKLPLEWSIVDDEKIFSNNFTFIEISNRTSFQLFLFYYRIFLDVIQPSKYLPHALTYIRDDLKLSISRDSKRLTWGIPVPNDPNQTVDFEMMKIQLYF